MTNTGLLRGVAVDDNLEFLEALEAMLENSGSVVLIDKATSVRQGIRSIVDNKPDVVFLDVELSGGTGFDILKSFDEIDFNIIFTTAYEHYALQAIKFSALDYLLKPFGQEDLDLAISKLNGVKYLNSSPIETLFSNLFERNFQNKKIGLHTQEGIYYIDLKDIIRCKADRNYTEFYFTNRDRVIVSVPIKKYTILLKDFGFCRVHHSHLINCKHIVHFAKTDGGILTLSDGSMVDVSRNKRNELLSLLEELR